MFQPVDPKISFPEIEHKILHFWQKNNIFEKSVSQRKSKKKYVFFDGPPFANGLPHYGHILANAIKDAVTRYWTMCGYYVPRTNGWDCHGLPVEYEIEKELNLNGRSEIIQYGISNFNQKCRESVFRYTKEWEDLLVRIARWVDFENSYATLENPYIESIWWVFKQIWEKEMIYKGHKSMHTCPRCVTPLSNFEVGLGYKDVTDLSITAKFELKNQPGTYILAWTTTPWTLPGNAALAFGPNIEYVKATVGQNKYILARKLVDKVFEKQEHKPEKLEKVDLKDLIGQEFKPLFNYFVNSKLENIQNAWKIIETDFVTTEDGTGVVHIAPGFGEDDYNAGLEHHLPLISHVGMDGKFTDQVQDFAGKFVKGQEHNIADYLESQNLLFEKQNYRHSYPHCWRCDTPLLNYTTTAWFIAVSKLKNELLENNQKINWQPAHIKDGRFGKWLENVRDWNISRNRFWGAPIPIWECSCGNLKCVGSIEELKGNLPKNEQGELDLHKPYIDEIKLPCEKCSKQMERIPDVLDCWFESGAMPYAQLHYPFENKTDFEQNFPADFIAEGLDQTRGWFYTLHVLATILFDSPAFKNVIVNGILLAADGEKLSKRKKNYPDPNQLFETKGVDSTRFFLYSSTAPLAEDVRFSESHVDEIIKKFTLTLWNTYSFFITYASIDKWKPGQNDSTKHKLDQWIISELHNLINEVTLNMDEYNLTKATRPMIDFIDNLSNWYVRRSRRRFWKSQSDQDKNEAYQTLYTVLVTFAKLLAPFMPFLSDEIYKNLTQQESVHLTDWPKSDKKFIKPNLNLEIKITRQIVNLGHAARAKAGIKVRQPLSSIQIALPAKIDAKILIQQKDVILEELNLKSLKIVKDIDKHIKLSLKPDPKKLGPKYGRDVQKILQLAKEGKFEILKNNSVKIGQWLLENDETEIIYEGKAGFDVESQEGIVVLLDTKITPQLKEEGYARELVRHLQDLRKEAGYKVSDRIYSYIHSAGQIELSVTNFADYIKQEILSIELQQKGDFESDLEKIIQIDQNQVKIAVRKA